MRVPASLHTSYPTDAEAKSRTSVKGYEPKRCHWVLAMLYAANFATLSLKFPVDREILILGPPLLMRQTLTSSNCDSKLSIRLVNSDPYDLFVNPSQFLLFEHWNSIQETPPLPPPFLPKPLTMVTTSSSPFTTPVKNPAKVAADVTYNGIKLTATAARSFKLGSFTEAITPSYRETLAGKDLFEFQKQAVVPLDPLFTLSWASISVSTDNDFFAHNNKVMTQLYLLRNRLQTFCMTSVFNVLPINPNTGNLNTKEPSIDLLSKACVTSEVAVRMSNQVYAENTSEKIHPQNLAWTQDLLLSSCDSTLRSDLEHRLITIPDNEQGGPLILHMIMNQLMSTMHEAARAIVNRLQAHSVTDYPGENIANFCATFNNVALRLSISRHLPNDLSNIFYRRLCTCSVGKLTSFLETLEHTESPILEDFQELRETVVRKYNQYLLSGDWLPTSRGQSSFATGVVVPPLPAGLLGPGKNQNQGNAAPTSNTFTTKTGVSDTKRSDQKEIVIDRNPPGDGAPNFRQSSYNPNRREWWCANCDRWGNHSTDRHDKFKDRQRSRRNRNRPSDGDNEGSVTTSSGNSTLPSPSTPASSTSGPGGTTATSTFSIVSTAKRDFC
ncbi:hypothetical protein ACA910_018973 [Epithemia clementina (nom. ined.)]